MKTNKKDMFGEIVQVKKPRWTSISDLLAHIEIFFEGCDLTTSAQDSKISKPINFVNSSFIVGKVLEGHNKTMKEIQQMYEDVFVSLLPKFKCWKVDKQLSESNGVHPSIYQFVKFAKAILLEKNKALKYCIFHEQGMQTLDEQSSVKCTKRPDFSFVSKANCSSVYDIVVPIVGKMNVCGDEQGIFQAIGYTMERLYAYYILSGNVNESNYGVSIASDGEHMAIGYVEVKNQLVTVKADTIGIRWWTENYTTPESLSDVPGFLLLLSLLHIGETVEDGLGYKQYHSIKSLPELKGHNILGIGSFCIAIECTFNTGNDDDNGNNNKFFNNSYKRYNNSFAVKLPNSKYIANNDETHLVEVKAQMDREYKILSMLAKTTDKAGVLAFPTVLQYREDIPCLYFKEVGVSVASFLSRYGREFGTRRLITHYVHSQIIDGLNAAHSMNLVHGDIRPDNIVIHYDNHHYCNYDNTNNDIIEEGVNVMNIRTLIIDWGLGGVANVTPYHGHFGDIHFRSQSIQKYMILLEEQQSKNNSSEIVPQLLLQPEFDTIAADYIAISMLYCNMNLSAPWKSLVSAGSDAYEATRIKICEDKHKIYSKQEIVALYRMEAEKGQGRIMTQQLS